MIRTIITTTEAASLSDLTTDWKIAARLLPGTAGWTWSGSLANEEKQFRAMAFPQRPAAPTVSVVSGKVDNRIVLYARIFPRLSAPREQR